MTAFSLLSVIGAHLDENLIPHSSSFPFQTRIKKESSLLHVVVDEIHLCDNLWSFDGGNTCL